MTSTATYTGQNPIKRLVSERVQDRPDDLVEIDTAAVFESRLIFWGWILAVLLAPAGAIVGVVLMVRGRLVGLAQLVLAILVVLFAASVL